MQTLIVENGSLIDYAEKWIGNLSSAPHIERKGWKVFHKDGSFAGILDERKMEIWYVNEDTLRKVT